MADRPTVVGKRDEQGNIMLPAWGALDADGILPVLRARLEPRVADRLVPARKERVRIPVSAGVNRTPFFCSGCPHNRSTEVPDGAVVGAGIGCHTMTLLMDEERVGDIAGLTAMGNEGTQWVGMADFVEHPHLIQNLGDGTFFHSGQLAIQAAIASGVNMTYKLLYNGTVAMTGGQDPEGQLGVAEIVSVLQTQGAAEVLVTSDDVKRTRALGLPRSLKVWDRDRLIEAQEYLATVPGVTVLIHDQACAAEARRARKRGLVKTPNQRVVINHRICEGCGDCGQVSNCLSVQPMETEFGRKTTIDQTTCNLDFSCLEGDCPSFMTITTKEPGRLGRFLSNRKATPPAAVDSPEAPAPPAVPDPVPVVPTDDFAMRITGIGGTGVVTVAQIIGTAAMLDGFDVRGLDQIGLSQKAGPVVSDVRLSKNGPSFTNRLGEAQADLLLAFDQLVAASDKGMLTSDADRTLVVGSSSATPTGAMITHPDIAMPSADELELRIGDMARDGQHWADAQLVTTELFGSSTTANIFVIGMAVQAGALPISATSIEAAIGLNGVAVDANVAAFHWGRVQVHNAAMVEDARNGGGAAQVVGASVHQERWTTELDACGADGGLRERLDVLGSELEAWGSTDTTKEWFAALQRVVPGDAPGLLSPVAEGLFKLMAYKDEYEVARLMLDADGMADANAVAGADGAIAWKLHPPMLRARGIDRKITLGAWATPGISLLAQSKRLRGSAVDPFGRAEVRRVERALPAEYLAAVEAALRIDTECAVRVAGLADLVRGYEDIKLANVERFRAAVASELNPG
jgi:indolepyruvate ferredoxin oxidoreductase